MMSGVVDYIIVSAFPNEYSPVPGTVIESLEKRALSVAALAAHKEYDLRANCGFWISRDLSKSHPNIGFRRLLCFEPRTIGSPPEVVGEIFRGLFPFLDISKNSTVATSLIAAGSQQFQPREMFRPLVEAAIKWLQRGLPLDELRIVVRNRVLAAALSLELSEIAATMEGCAVTNVPSVYDVFLSYSSLDMTTARSIKELLKRINKNARIFDFKNEIDVGKSYQTVIDRKLSQDHCADEPCLFCIA
jgi:hypothetical protein